jgi:hypothetical protein
MPTFCWEADGRKLFAGQESNKNLAIVMRVRFVFLVKAIDYRLWTMDYGLWVLDP